ncbi:unnamed protein product [Scytosiphon promiscuus]
MVKVLLAGDVNGSVTQLLAKVSQYHKSGAGPFDIVFAVGPLTSPDGGGEGEAALSPVLAGETPPAVPVYFFEAGGSASLGAKLEEHDSEVQEVASNLFYLGRGGIKTVDKLTVAFLSSSHKPDDLESCRKVASMAGYGGADLLLTSEWGRGMEVDLPDRCFQELSAAGVAPAAVGSEAVAELAVAVKPRYHFAASEGAFFQRPPYRNFGNSGSTHTTRFIALGDLSTGSAAPKDKTKKWMHALNLEPISFMKKEELSRRSVDTTDCPYVARKVLGGAGGGRGGGGGVGGGPQGGGDKAWASRISAQEEARRADSGMFFWGGRGGGGPGRGGGRGGAGGGRGPSGPVDPNNTTVFVGNLKSGDVTTNQLEVMFRAVGPLSGAPGVGDGPGANQPGPRTECWFCLASPQLEDHLVCSVADEVYLAQPKGGLVPGHVLIIPVSHQQRYSDLSEEGAKEAERFKDSFSRYCFSCACEPFFFERCVPTKGALHLHIQAVPIPSGEASRGARILMRSEGIRHGMTFDVVSDEADLRATLKEGQYFYAELPGDVVGSKVRLLHRVAEGGNTDSRGNRRNVPLQFGRDVAARLLSMPERAHWRDCALPKPKEILQADIFKEAFKPFDFTQQEDEAEVEDMDADDEDGTPAAAPEAAAPTFSGQKRTAAMEEVETGKPMGAENGGDESEKRARGSA